MDATIKDVAKRAGVSVKTVSRVLNQEKSVSADTRQRVQDAVESHGYTRHQTARELRTQRSDTIGFITDKIATSPFAADVVKGTQDEALKAWAARAGDVSILGPPWWRVVRESGALR
jgi:LacI family transcriptional regulator